MYALRNYKTIAFAAATLVLFTFGCQTDLDELKPATFPTNGDVFADGFTGGLDYFAFGNSFETAFDVVSEPTYEGTAAMQFAVPDEGNPEGSFAGGTFILGSPRDLSGYNALTFWARASQPANINEIGFGNDFGDNEFIVVAEDLAVNTNWQKYYVPIPNPEVLTQERGLLFYSEGPENGRGYTFWIDEVQFEQVDGLGEPTGFVFDGVATTESAETGTTFSADPYITAVLPTGAVQRVSAAPAYFEFTSSNPSVASVDSTGTVTVRDSGTAVITATLDEMPVNGSLTVNSQGAAPAPNVAAPVPEIAAENVISIYSGEYEDVPVDFYNGFWEFSTTQNQFVEIGGNEAIRYSQLNFVGIQFTEPTIDISAMTHLRMDVWTAENTDPPAMLKILLVDLGPNNAFGGDDDSSFELAVMSPTLRTGEWVTLDIPLSSFPTLTGRMNLAQIVLSGDIPNIYVDNLLFYEDDGSGGGGEDAVPAAAAPMPDQEAANVISLFSGAYDDVMVDTWRTDWSNATLTDIEIDGNATKQYTMMDFVGIETTTTPVDASNMTTLHLDIWSPDATFFGIKLVDFGADGAFGGGDDVEHQVNFEMPANGEWVGLDIPLDDFTGLTTRSSLAQYILVAQPTATATVYVDNMYFYGDGGGSATEPAMVAPAPTQEAANVISLFSGAYDNVTVDTWRTDWSSATLTDIEIEGNATKLYTMLDFVGIETVANPVDITEMTTLHVDIWSPDATLFGIKLVDLGPNGAFGGEDDVEHQVNIEMPANGQWVSLDIPLEDFTGLTTRSNIAQYILVGQPTGEATVYVDNMYFYGEGGGGNATEPDMAAPVPPMRDAANVVSLFSEAYDDVMVNTWRTDWSAATLTDVEIEGNATKLYTMLDFVGIETNPNTIDVSGMTTMHLDIWTPDATLFGIKLVDFGADGAFGGGDDVEHQLNFEMPANGQWVSLDIPLSDFTGLTTTASLAQYILVAQPTATATLYVDNMYFYRE